MITASLVKKLRDMTGAGMMDCKKALVETNGDVEAAAVYLREHGIAKAAKKAERIAAEGVAKFVIDGNVAVIYEVNSETDFVAKNDNFIQLVDNIGQIILESSVTNTEDALKATNEAGDDVAKLLAEGTATIGERFNLRRVSRIEKTDSQVFGAYSHMQGKIIALTVLEGSDEETARDVAMHVAAMNPRYVREADVDPAELEKEKEILTQETLNEGKPANIAERIVTGRLRKYLEDICLVDQKFIKDSDQTVGQFAKANKGEILSFVRLEVGEGLEKREEDFAAEVAAQLNK